MQSNGSLAMRLIWKRRIGCTFGFHQVFGRFGSWYLIVVVEHYAIDSGWFTCWRMVRLIFATMEFVRIDWGWTVSILSSIVAKQFRLYGTWWLWNYRTTRASIECHFEIRKHDYLWNYVDRSDGLCKIESSQSYCKDWEDQTSSWSSSLSSSPLLSNIFLTSIKRYHRLDNTMSTSQAILHATGVKIIMAVVGRCGGWTFVRH